MLGWFRSTPVCPVGPEAKRWVEERLQWLTEQFAPRTMAETQVVLPTEEYFPDPYHGTRADCAALFHRVCEYMEVEPDRVKLRFYRERKPPKELGWEGLAGGTAGLYQEMKIGIEESQLDDVTGLIGTMAHELAHVHLLGDGRVTPDTEDHEPLTDLLTVFLGLGIFCANSALREHVATDGNLNWWNLSSRGYLAMEVYGYAFAQFAWHRHEDNPAWAKYLRGDVSDAFWKGLRYLLKTGDSAFPRSPTPPAPDDAE